MKFFQLSPHNRSDSFTARIFGLWLHFGWAGNCTTPAIHFQVTKCDPDKDYTFTNPRTGAKERCNPAKAILKLRGGLFGLTGPHVETTIYFRVDGTVDWNSEHVAVLFGEFEETDFGGMYRYDSETLSPLVGRHVCL